MTSRELIQQRATTESGDTCWRVSPLVEAALKGRLAVLDGMHRVDTGTLSVLKRFGQRSKRAMLHEFLHEFLCGLMCAYMCVCVYVYV